MTRFTDSPYETLMTQKPRAGKPSHCASSLPSSHPCYGCSRAGQTCVGLCHREMADYLKKRKKTHE